MSRNASESKRTVIVALAANLAIALAKGGAGALSGSAAMLAEAAHSLADTANQGFMLVSLRLGRRHPNEAHPFGYGKERFFWSFLAAVFIFVSGAVFSIGQGVLQLINPEKETATDFIANYVVLGVAFAAEGVSWLRALRQVRAEAGERDKDLFTYVRESRDPTVKTVLSEDSAALTGLVLAGAGVALHQVTGNHAFDALASIAIGILLAFVAVALGRDTKGLLLGEAALPEERERIRALIADHREVDHVAELMTMAIGPEQLLVAARLDLADGLEAGRVEELCLEIDHLLRREVPNVAQVFLDPTSRTEQATGIGAESAAAPGDR